MIFISPQRTKLLILFAALGLFSGALGYAQENPMVYVRHIEPVYYGIAAAARIQGSVKLKLKISPEGNVIDAIPLPDDMGAKPNGILVITSVDQVKRWTFGCFDCAAGAEYEHVFTFIYKLEGAPTYDRPTKTVMDLPNTVTVTSTPMQCDHCPLVAPYVSLIGPGQGVGVLVALTATKKSLEEVGPPMKTIEHSESQPDCEARTEMMWPEFDAGGTVSAFLRNDTVFLIESATRRYRTYEGITLGSSPAQIKKYYKDLDAYVLDPSGGRESDFHDLNYWIDRKDGIAFELAFSAKNRRRQVSKVIVFEPGAKLFPEGCIPPTQRWFQAPNLSFSDN